MAAVRIITYVIIRSGDKLRALGTGSAGFICAGRLVMMELLMFAIGSAALFISFPYVLWAAAPVTGLGHSLGDERN